ncbi:MAG: SRPBCC domain-containing protein [Pseudomonadales bacterium]
MRTLLAVLSLALLSTLAIASESLIDEPDGKTYNFVSHYSIEIDAPAHQVWKHLINLGSWMIDFEMAPVSGFDTLEGRVLRLYEGQDFHVQITKAIPSKLLVLTNLPMSMEGEQLASGTSVTTLTESAGKTTVGLTMSRRYVWTKPGENHLKARRQSETFIKNTRATWGRFLQKLSDLSSNEFSTPAGANTGSADSVSCIRREPFNRARLCSLQPAAYARWIRNQGVAIDAVIG